MIIDARRLSDTADIRGSIAIIGKLGCTALEEPQAIARVLYHRLRAGPVQGIRIAMEGEQSPNPAIRVTLGDEVDSLGMRKAATI
jgi:hypothetical protein